VNIPNYYKVNKIWSPEDENIIRIGDTVEFLSSPGGDHGEYLIGKTGRIYRFEYGEKETKLSKYSEQIAFIKFERNGQTYEVGSYIRRLKKV
jgi:hypothetical protein